MTIRFIRDTNEFTVLEGACCNNKNIGPNGTREDGTCGMFLIRITPPGNGVGCFCQICNLAYLTYNGDIPTFMSQNDSKLQN